jgi:ribosomal protein S2
VGHPHEINPESRFLALGTRKGHVIADLNYSSFLARRASLFLFGSLVRRSHPAVSFGYRFYDYEDLFSEFSSLSLSYVRDWVPGLLTNYKVLFRTALKEEGALRRIGFFFQFPDILLMFGANDSMGFIVNEARAIRIPTIVTGDTSISFSRITYMLLSNYKSFKSTVFFVKLFLDLNAEALRFRTLRHYSIFKRFIKSIFLRRTLKSKLFSIKLSKMFFIFKAVPGLRVSKITPVVYKKGNWRLARFFKVPAKQKGKLGGRSVMRRLYEGRVDRLIPISRREYAEKRRLSTKKREPFRAVLKLRRDRLIRAFRVSPKRGVPFNALVTRLEKAKALKRGVDKVRLLRRRVKVPLVSSLVANRSKRFRKLLMVARRKGLRVEVLLKGAALLFKRLRLLNKPKKGCSYEEPLPISMVRRTVFRQIFPLFGYFAYGYMSKRLNTLFFYRAIFRQIVQKRKKILRLKGFTSDLKVISIQAKKFRALNSAVNRRRPSIWKLRARVKEFGKKLRVLSKLNKLRKRPGFDEKLFLKKLLDNRKLNKLEKQRRGDKSGKRDWVDKRKEGDKRQISGKRMDSKFSGKDNRGGASKRRSGSSPRPVKVKGVFAELTGNLNKRGIQGSVPTDKPKWLEDLGRMNGERYEALGRSPRLKTKKENLKVLSAKGKESKLITKLASVTLAGNQRALVVRNFTPAQRHILRLYRILSLRYPSFIRKSEANLSFRRKATLFPRTLRQYLVKSRRLKSEAFRKRTGKILKFRKTIESLIPKPFKHRGFKRRGGKNPWHKSKGKSFGGDFKKPYDSNYSRNKKGWVKGGRARYSPDYDRKGSDFSKKSYYNPNNYNDGGDNRYNNAGGRGVSHYAGSYTDKSGYRDRGPYNKSNNALRNPRYSRGAGWSEGGRFSKGGYASDRINKGQVEGDSASRRSDYKGKGQHNRGERRDSGISTNSDHKRKSSGYYQVSYNPNHGDKVRAQSKHQNGGSASYKPDHRSRDWKNSIGGDNHSDGSYRRSGYRGEGRYNKQADKDRGANVVARSGQDKRVGYYPKKSYNSEYNKVKDHKGGVPARDVRSDKSVSKQLDCHKSSESSDKKINKEGSPAASNKDSSGTSAGKKKYKEVFFVDPRSENGVKE